MNVFDCFLLLINVQYYKMSIYAIVPLKNTKLYDVYIGSTSKEIETRFNDHKNGYSIWKQKGGYYENSTFFGHKVKINGGINRENDNTEISSFIMFEKYGIDGCRIVLVEEVNLKLIKLIKREEQFINMFKCVNCAMKKYNIKRKDLMNFSQYKIIPSRI